jgi:hypothetical protein
MHKAQFHIFVLTSLIESHIWKSSDWNNESPTSPDKDITELLTYWAAAL